MSSPTDSHTAGMLPNIWIEIPSFCPLNCAYCFAKTNTRESLEAVPPLDFYRNIIKDFAGVAQGDFQIAIPARGEPFYESNHNLVFDILQIAKETAETTRHNIRTIIFTAADLAESEVRKIARAIKEGGFRTLILVKCNCNWIMKELPADNGRCGVRGNDKEGFAVYDDRRDKGRYLQDILTPRLSDATPTLNGGAQADVHARRGAHEALPYTDNRNRAIQVFVEEFLEAPGQEHGLHRVGIVTSLVKYNAEARPDGRPWLAEYLRVARELGARYGKDNFVFDCDTLLHHGREARAADDPSPDVKRDVFRILQEEDLKRGEYWPITPTYVGGTCHRFDRHVYVELDGTVRPCVGCREVVVSENGAKRKKKSGFEYDVIAGKSPNALTTWWQSTHSSRKQIIQKHRYYGACCTCLNFLLGDPSDRDRRCYSCLGRSTTGFTTEEVETAGYVKTKGCWNHRDDPLELLDRCAGILREANALAGLGAGRPFWHDVVEREPLETLWSGTGDFAADVSMLTHLHHPLPQLKKGKVLPLKREDLLAHVLFHPLKRLFVKEELRDPVETWQSPYAKFFESKGDHNVVRWVAVFIYDEKSGSYFVRTIAHPSLGEHGSSGQPTAFDVLRLLIRYRDYGNSLANNSYDNLILDVSDTVRDIQGKPGEQQFLSEYCLQLGAGLDVTQDGTVESVLPSLRLDCHAVFQSKSIAGRAATLRQQAESFCTNTDNADTLTRLSREPSWILTDALQLFYTNMPLYKNDSDFWGASDSNELLAPLKHICDTLGLDRSKMFKLANYFLWLRAVDPKVSSYEVFLSGPRRREFAAKGNGAAKASMKSLFGVAVAAKKKLSNPSVYYLRSLLGYLLNPLEDQVDMAVWQRTAEEHQLEMERVRTVTAESIRHRVQQEERSSIARKLQTLAKQFTSASESLSVAYSWCFEAGAIKTLTHDMVYAIHDASGWRWPDQDEDLVALASQQLDILKCALNAAMQSWQPAAKEFGSQEIAKLERFGNEVRALGNLRVRDYRKIKTLSDYTMIHKTLTDLRSEYFERDGGNSASWTQNICKSGTTVDDCELLFPVEAVLSKEIQILYSALESKSRSTTGQEQLGLGGAIFPCVIVAPKKEQADRLSLFTRRVTLVTLSWKNRLPKSTASTFQDLVRTTGQDFLSLAFGRVFLWGSDGDYIVELPDWEDLQLDVLRVTSPVLALAIEKRCKALNAQEVGTAIIWAFEVQAAEGRSPIDYAGAGQ